MTEETALEILKQLKSIDTKMTTNFVLFAIMMGIIIGILVVIELKIHDDR